MKTLTFSPAVIQVFENAPENLLIHGKGSTRSCDSDEEDAESLRAKLLEDVKEKRKPMAEVSCLLNMKQMLVAEWC